MPSLGMAFWLLGGGRLTDRMEWLIRHGFKGVSFSQSAIGFDEKERQDLAAAISSAQLHLTYHGNVHHRLTGSGELDTEFTRQLIDDVIWWHENTPGVYSCCSDAIHVPGKDGRSTFDFDLNRRHLRMMAEGLEGSGIRIGIENSCGGRHKFCSLEDIARFKEMCAWETGMLLDAAHANIHVRSDGMEGETEIDRYVGLLPLEVLEVHFSDNFGRQDEHKGLGYGNLDLKALFKALKRIGFSGKFTIEVCVDILSGKYAADIYDPAKTDPILISRDTIQALWNEAD